MSQLSTFSMPSKAYGDNRSVLFQFILDKFISACAEMNKIQRVIKDAKLKKSNSTEHQDFLQVLALLNSFVINLLSTAECGITEGSENFEKGILTQLKLYCRLYLQSHAEHDQKTLTIHSHVNQAWLQSLKSLDLLQSLYTFSQKTPLTAPHLAPVLQVLGKVNYHLRQMANLIKGLLHHFYRDENIVFFLLRDQKKFGELFGAKFIPQLIHRMYPKGLKDAERFLIKKYKARGFEHLAPMISKSISTLAVFE